MGETVTVATEVEVVTVREVAVVAAEEAVIVVLAEVVEEVSSLVEVMVATVTVETITKDIKALLKIAVSGDVRPTHPIRRPAREEVAEVVVCLQAVAATTQPLSHPRGALSRSSTTTRTASKIVVMMVTVVQSTDRQVFSQFSSSSHGGALMSVI